MGAFLGALREAADARPPNTMAFAGIFPFKWLPNTGNFDCIEHMRLSREGITGKTVLGSVVNVATTQQKLPSLRIAGPRSRLSQLGSRRMRHSVLADCAGVSTPMKT